MSISPAADFRLYCQNLNKNQIRAVYWKELENDRDAYAQIAAAVGTSMGVDVTEYRVEWREH